MMVLGDTWKSVMMKQKQTLEPVDFLLSFQPVDLTARVYFYLCTLLFPRILNVPRVHLVHRLCTRCTSGSVLSIMYMYKA